MIKFQHVGKGMSLYLCIAQIALEGSSRKVFYMYISLMHDIMALTKLYDDMHGLSLIVSIRWSLTLDA